MDTLMLVYTMKTKKKETFVISKSFYTTFLVIGKLYYQNRHARSFY